jgi:hypothetical protein
MPERLFEVVDVRDVVEVDHGDLRLRANRAAEEAGFDGEVVVEGLVVVVVALVRNFKMPDSR